MLYINLDRLEIEIGGGELHVKATYAIRASVKSNMRDTVEKAIARWIAGKKLADSSIDMACVDNYVICYFRRIYRMATPSELKDAIDTVEGITLRLMNFVAEATKILEFVSKFDDIGVFTEIIRNMKEAGSGNQNCQTAS